ncbi:MAG: iron-containing alcohol dehydrogenase [Anaerolineales bacterium]
MTDAATGSLPRFEFATAARILFGAGIVRELGATAAGYGKRVLLASGVPETTAEPAVESLQAAGAEVELWPVTKEPDLEGILAAVRRAVEGKSEVIVGLGGGSAMDTAKAAAALAVNPGDPLDYLEVVGKGLPLERPGLPCIAVPTTAGTGAEVTRNAVIAVPERKVKVSLRNPWLLPRAALIDPELTLGLPPAVTAATGMDALTQVLEPYVCSRANPLTDGFCREGMRRAGRSLRAAFTEGGLAAREDMCLASLCGGLALANAGLGAVHGFAAPLGGLLAAPHGAVCARLLPVVMRANIRALRARDPEAPSLQRYGEIAALLTGRENAAPEEGADWAQRLAGDLRIPPLRSWGLRESDFDAVADNARRASSMKANPVALSPEELMEILREAQ